MANYITTSTDLTAVANAIRTKGGTNASLSFPNGFVSAIEDIPTGSGGGSVSVPEKEVNFRDYDGTVVYSYTPEEFAALTAMPANPDHSKDTVPLTSQGWNWSLADAQAYVAKCGWLEVGQMYIPTDGKTHILIHLNEGRISPTLNFYHDDMVEIDWGDGTAHSTYTTTIRNNVKAPHAYAAPGDYDIKLSVSGNMEFVNSILRYSNDSDNRDNVYQNAVRRIYIGNGVTIIGMAAFKNCLLASITIPNGVTTMEGSAFVDNRTIQSITIPSTVTTLQGAISRCRNLKSVSIPNGITTINSGDFSDCTALTNFTIPSSVTSIKGGAFNGCSVLTSLAIPDSVTSIESYAFGSCKGLASIRFASTTPPSIADSNVFSLVPTDCKIYVPAGSLSAYTSATNYPSSSTYTYIEE